VDLVNIKDEYEPYADIIVKSQPLNATKVTGNEVPLLIDEIPLIALCATQAEGETIIEGVQELRVKETDRINSIISNLNNMGANIHHIDNSIIIKGPARLKGAAVKSFGDHRTAMMLVIAANIAEGMTNIDDIACIAKSFPDFLDRLKTLAL
jgi:3-phosphoshikimate 1-carboxyvinyltransferase